MPQRLLQHVARLRSRQILLMGKPRMRNARRPSSAHLQPAAPVSTAVRKVFDGLGTWVADSLSAGLKVNCHVETRVNNVLSARVCTSCIPSINPDVREAPDAGLPSVPRRGLGSAAVTLDDVYASIDTMSWDDAQSAVEELGVPVGAGGRGPGGAMVGTVESVPLDKLKTALKDYFAKDQNRRRRAIVAKATSVLLAQKEEQHAATR